MAVRIARLIEEYLVSDHLQDILAEKTGTEQGLYCQTVPRPVGNDHMEYTTLLKMEKAKELLSYHK